MDKKPSGKSKSLSSEEIREMLNNRVKEMQKLDRERAEAIVNGTQLEELLGQLLSEFLVDSKETKQFLDNTICTFSSRIQLAFLLGHISEYEKNDLEIIRKIRNHFAHSEVCSFSDQKINDLCSNFKIPGLRPNLFEGYSNIDTFHAVAFVLQQNMLTRSWKAERGKRIIPEEIDSEEWAGYW